MKAIGARIKEARKKAGLKQNELAKLLQVSESRISQYENGTQHPRVDTIHKIAKALGVKTKDLVDTSIWEEFDQEHPEMVSQITKDQAFKRYLQELRFTIAVSPSNECTMLSRDGCTATFTATEFEELEKGAKELIEGMFYKKVVEQGKKK